VALGPWPSRIRRLSLFSPRQWPEEGGEEGEEEEWGQEGEEEGEGGQAAEEARGWEGAQEEERRRAR
jgi:hypothetical protein